MNMSSPALTSSPSKQVLTNIRNLGYGLWKIWIRTPLWRIRDSGCPKFSVDRNMFIFSFGDSVGLVISRWTCSERYLIFLFWYHGPI